MFGDLANLGNLADELRKAIAAMLAEQQKTNDLISQLIEELRRGH